MVCTKSQAQCCKLTHQMLSERPAAVSPAAASATDSYKQDQTQIHTLAEACTAARTLGAHRAAVTWACFGPVALRRLLVSAAVAAAAALAATGLVHEAAGTEQVHALSALQAVIAAIRAAAATYASQSNLRSRTSMWVADLLAAGSLGACSASVV